MKRIYWIGIIVLILLAACIFVYREYNRERADSYSLKPLFKVKALDLLKEFLNNEQRANLKYAGQNIIIEVTGMVKEVIKNEQGNYIIIMGDTSSLSSVRCSIDTLYTSSGNNLQRGSIATIKGNFNGYKADEMGIGADVEFNFCVVTSPAPSIK